MKQIRIQGEENSVLPIRDASFPSPFRFGLEFNSPAHGTWNIVHTGMLIPKARQIYVCAENCMRGVVLTAAEMKEEDRFSFVILEESDMIGGNLEQITVEGVSACLDQCDEKPPVVLLFTVCIHHFLGCDLDYIYRKLEERYPDIVFVRCFMDPLLQKKGPTPDQKLRSSMYDPIGPRPIRKGTVALIGSDLPLEPGNDMEELVQAAGGTLREISRVRTYEEYLALGEAELFAADYPAAQMGLERLSKRLERPGIYLPMTFHYEEIRSHWKLLTEMLRMDQSMDWAKKMDQKIELKIAQCEDIWARAYQMIGKTEIVIDYTIHPRPLGLARFLLTRGFRVTEVYLDSINPEEESDFFWLQEHFPELKLKATIHVDRRVDHSHFPGEDGGRKEEGTESEKRILALGQKAAWFAGTAYFVNMVQGGGLFGFHGIRKMAEYVMEAWQEKKDTRDLVIRKGWGCESCI